MIEIVELYELALDYYKKNILLVCIDQKTGIQALERIFPDKIVKPGQIKRIEHGYYRHGIRNLIAGFVVATGKVFGKLYGRNRNFELSNFLAGLFNTHNTYDKIHVIADNYGTATHINTCLMVAKFCNVKISKNKLKTKEQRVKFLKSNRKWVVFHSLPTHASWLNQIEIWFSILHRKIIKKGNFSSLNELDNKIMNYIECEWNKKNAHPFQWTYKGKTCYA
jgi:transposase